MLAPINKNEEITTHLKLCPNGQHLEKIKSTKTWRTGFKLTSMNSPEILDNPKHKKIFKLRFSYVDDVGKKRTHVVFFGSPNDYIFTHDKDARVKRILRMKNIDNPFHSDYWSAHLTNKCETLKEGLEKFTDFFIENNNKDLEKKIEERKPKIA